MASIYLRGKNWWITYRIGGRNIAHSLGTKNARVAEELKSKYAALKTNGLIPEPSKTLIVPFLQTLCQQWRRERKRKGADTDIGRLRGFFGPCCPEMELRPHTPLAYRAEHATMPVIKDENLDRCLPVRYLEQITPHMITEHLRQRFVDEEICGKTANRIRGALSSMFEFAINNVGYNSPDPKYRHPVEKVPRFAETDLEISWLTTEQIEKQLAALSDQPQIRTMVAFYIYSGLRRSEGLWLTKSDVDLDERLIRVRKKTVDGEFWEPKTGKERVVPIGEKLHDILMAYTQPTGDWFFRSPSKKRWDPDLFSETLREINEAHDLEWSCLDFRHTFGSHLAQKGVSLFQISELMGNSPEICRKHYAALMPQKMHREVEF